MHYIWMFVDRTQFTVVFFSSFWSCNVVLATCILSNFRSDLKGLVRDCLGFNSIIQKAKLVGFSGIIQLLIELKLLWCF